MQLSVSAVKPLAKSLAVTANGKDYLAKKDSGITAGMTIDAEVEDSEYNGKTYHWIKKYRAVGNGSASGQSHAPNTNGGGDRWYMPFVSNTVAHAITAGLIKEPSDVKVWAAAAKQAAQELG